MSEALIEIAAPAATGDYEFIDTAEHLARWIDATRTHMELAGETRCCLDTEADSLHHYH